MLLRLTATASALRTAALAVARLAGETLRGHRHARHVHALIMQITGQRSQMSAQLRMRGRSRRRQAGGKLSIDGLHLHLQTAERSIVHGNRHLLRTRMQHRRGARFIEPRIRIAHRHRSRIAAPAGALRRGWRRHRAGMQRRHRRAGDSERRDESARCHNFIGGLTAMRRRTG